MHPHEGPQGQYVRLSCRVDARIKSRAEEAAALLGQSITDFTEEALADKAQAVLDRHARITLSDQNFAKFLGLIENPKPPTPALVDAMAKYEERKRAKPESNL